MDDILQIRDYFYAGYNNHCLNMYEELEGEDKKEAEEYVYQIYMVNNTKKEILLGLRNLKNENLYVLFLYYKYYYLGEREGMVPEVKNVKSTSSNANILKSRILFDSDCLDECFDLLEDGTIEMKAAKIFFLLSINRVDLAKDIVNEYLKMNDEIPIIKITLAIFYLYTNNSKESFLIFDDLESLYSSIVSDFSQIVFNGKGVSSMLNHEYHDAKEYLNGCLKGEMTNADTLFNLITCSLYLYELEEAEQYLNKLYTTYPIHESIDMLKKMDYEIDNFSAEF